MKILNYEPLADLHRHLDGSLRAATVHELADNAGLEVPEPLAFAAGMGLRSALALFEFTLALLKTPDSVCRVAGEMCQDAETDGVSTLEIRFAPQLHTGATPEIIVDAAADGVAGRAGLILCGLYGDPPQLIDRLVEIARQQPAVVGIDLAGGPRLSDTHSLADYQKPFAKAASLGLGRTVHAGEGRPPEEIRTAVEILGAQRIGHGTTVLQDDTIVTLLIERDVTIEACATSNVHVNAIPEVAAHPLPLWLDRGVKACICTDNTLFSKVQSREEHMRVAAIPGMTEEKMKIAIAHGHDAAFARR